jgi:predicted phage-related endonuclease
VLAEGLITRALEWFDTYVVAKVMPPADGSESAARLLSTLYPRNTSAMLEPWDEALREALLAREARAEVAAAEERQRRHDNRLREMIGTHEGIDGAATWRNNKDSRKTDWEAVARACGATAEIIGQHTETKPGARVLRLTIKEEA